MAASLDGTSQTDSRKRVKLDKAVFDNLPQPILDDKYLRTIETVDVYVCNVQNKKKTTEILRFLGEKYPLDKYQHLKRVKSSKEVIQIVICEESVTDRDSLSEILAPYKASLGAVGVVKVPGTAPLTRQQYEDSIQYWPVTFHENKQITRLLNGTLFDTAELKLIRKHMLAALEMGKKAKLANQVPIGAVMVDPATDTVKAEAYDLRHGDHPLHHATMVAIDMVARSQGGGMWKYPEDCEFYPRHKMTCAHDPAVSQKALPYLCTGYHLYITQEPCVMCAMALVHSRIQRVFYGSSLPEGALGSQYKLHVREALNHHYQVFAGVLKDECDQLYQEAGS